jgi:hypothetical protein
MATFALHRRRDPFWEVDGPAARAKRRKHRFVSTIAFAAAMAAVVGAAYMWVTQFGLVAFVQAQLGIG